MSVRQVLDTVGALLQDPGQGLAATIATLALAVEAEDAGSIPTMPIAASDLLVEFIPSRDDGSYSVLGTPALLPGRTAYAFDPGDAVVFDRALVDRVLNEGASGFTIMVAGSTATIPDATARSVLEMISGADDSLYMALARVDATHAALFSGIAHNPTDYEGTQNDAVLPLGPFVAAIRYRRTAPVGQRVSTWVNGLSADRALNAYAPTEPPPFAPEVVAGTIATYPGSVFTLGATVSTGAPPVARAGYVPMWKAALSDNEVAQAMAWVAANYAVEV